MTLLLHNHRRHTDTMKSICALILTLIAYSTSNAQTNEIAGDWHVNASGFKFTLALAQQGEKYVAYLASTGVSCNEKLDGVSWDGEAGQLEFRRSVYGFTQWYRVTIADGVMIGRYTHAGGSKLPKPTDPLAYSFHITGWNGDYFNQLTPVVFDIIANGHRGRLRVDHAGDDFIGRLKFYAYQNSPNECLEEEITVTSWDGETLQFKRGGQYYRGEVNGAAITGQFTHGGGLYSWSGRRAEVLTYGIAPKTAEDRQSWQERTRRTLYRLMMAGNPQPLSMNVEILAEDLPPIMATPWKLRDDNPGANPQNYRITELRLTYTLPSWTRGAPITRVVHGYLAKPTGPPPAGLERYPLVVAVNGHGGSAWQTFNPASQFCWYGDAFARRGYMVLAVDLGHRPDADVPRFGSMLDKSAYLGYPDLGWGSDDPAHGNGFHPSIKPPECSGAGCTDWEEEGERTWDVMRAVDYAVSRSDVDPQRIAVTGLSMGGEVAAYLGALDTRIGVSIPAGYSPDLNLIKYRSNHGCWNWSFADIREYIDHSDLLALTTPRPLIVQTGKEDRVFSDLTLPFGGDKQVMRRARAAYGSAPIFHYLHPLDHEWQSGIAGGGLRYTTVVEPTVPGDKTWQTNGDTATDGRTVFDWVKQWLNF
jgi:dienelactone hydrolase